jgi:hypothetical protein
VDGRSASSGVDNNGHTAVGLNAYLGFVEPITGDWGRTIVNAGRAVELHGNPTRQLHSHAYITATATPIAATASPTPQHHHSYTNSDFDTQTNAHAEIRANAKASSHAAA